MTKRICQHHNNYAEIESNLEDALGILRSPLNLLVDLAEEGMDGKSLLNYYAF